jgi:hypothetical protein
MSGAEAEASRATAFRARASASSFRLRVTAMMDCRAGASAYRGSMDAAASRAARASSTLPTASRSNAR